MPSVRVANIIVGHGNLWEANYGTALPAGYNASGADSYGTDLDGDADWIYLGATMEGVELTYEPDYGEIEVDQLKDAARLFNQGLTVNVATQLAEATLENLLVAWGLPDSAYTSGAANSVGTFKIGVPDEDPVERAITVIGPAPLRSGDTADAGQNNNYRERIYAANRVVSVEGSSFNMRRTEATTFPVSFRVLPDDAATAGEEYGVIYDRYVAPA